MKRSLYTQALRQTALRLFLAASATLYAAQQAAAESADWPAYGGNAQANHYSPLEQINRSNVDQLEVAWTHRSGDFSNGRDGEWSFTSLQVTPIVTNELLYYCTPFGRVFALDPETGNERWMYDPQVQNKRSGLYPAICRGVSYWESALNKDGLCARRIIYGTRDAELIALDADTGELCPDFGENGKVSLKEDISGAASWEYYPTSPPLIIGDIAVIGAMVPDNDRVEVPSGVVRAFNVITGELAWAWEPVSEDYRSRHKDKLGNTLYHLGTPNVWAPISGDSELGLIYVPTGNPSPDLYGGNRDGIDFYGSSVVALHADSGEVAWHFQTVHNDIWDYDVPAQPVLFDIEGVGGGVKGLAQGTKMGHVFLLNRESGEPLYPIEERPVPQGGVPGETLSPTQPFPTHPPPLHLPQKLTEDDMSGFVYFDKRSCQKQFAQYRSEGMFTPPSYQGSVIYPATTGGINWGGLTIDPIKAKLYVNQMHLVSVVKLLDRQDYDDLNPTEGMYPNEYYPMTGTPYGANRITLFSPFGAPCSPRPWGSLTAVDLRSGKVTWREALGNTRDQAPWPIRLKTGTPNQGGSIATNGGLVFIAATTDRYFRAFNSDTGEELWRHDLPYAGNATPLSFRLQGAERQFVVIAAGGHGWSEPGDAIVAFALPVKSLTSSTSN